ncbi:MAG: heavy-metal-associated domain-containing protein [archaeon]
MKTIKIQISGMSCKNCSDKIENELKKLAGVHSVKVNLAEDKASISFEPAHLSEKTIEDKIMELGYSVKGKGEANATQNGEIKKTLLQGIALGIIPHLGCIGFVVASILGVTIAAEFFKPLLLNPSFFYGLIALSIVFATISSIIYLHKNGLLSAKGIIKKKNYLATMYGSTIIVSLLFLFVIFPMLTSAVYETAQTNTGTQTASVIQNQNTQATLSTNQNLGLQNLLIEVQIPCGGHAPLIISELQKVIGITQVKTTSTWNQFSISYDSTKTSKEQIMAQKIFANYPAKIVG